MTDRPLLQQYAATADAGAFVELVRRHGPMVRAAARRMAAGDADDVAQAVFILLSKKAAALAGRDSVAGWLYETTRLCARNARRSRGRRERTLNQFQEQTMRTQPTADQPAWIAVLDDALDQLPTDQKGVVLLRYLEGRSVADTAAMLRLSPAAVAKRAERAIGRLRNTFRARGYSVSAEEALGGLATQAGADPGSVAILSNVSAKTASAGASAAAKSAATAMLLTKVKVAAIVLAAVTMSGGVAVPVVRHAMATRAVPRPAIAASPPVAAAPSSLASSEDVAAMRRTLALLDKLAPDIRFDGVGLGDAMRFLNEVLSLPVDVDWTNVATIGVNETAPVTLRMRNVKAGKVLQSVLGVVGGPAPLIYVVTPAGRIAVGTRPVLFARFAVERRYPLAAQIAPQLAVADRSALQAQVVALITGTIAVDTWQNDGRSPGGQWRWDADTLVVTQTPDVHFKIVDLIAELSGSRTVPAGGAG